VHLSPCVGSIPVLDYISMPSRRPKYDRPTESVSSSTSGHPALSVHPICRSARRSGHGHYRHHVRAGLLKAGQLHSLVQVCAYLRIILVQFDSFCVLSLLKSHSGALPPVLIKPYLNICAPLFTFGCYRRFHFN